MVTWSESSIGGCVRLFGPDDAAALFAAMAREGSPGPVVIALIDARHRVVAVASGDEVSVSGRPERRAAPMLQ